MIERNDRVWQSASVSHDFLEGMRGAIPLAAEQLAVMVRVIQEARPNLDNFLDLGCGDGVLGQAVLAHYPDAHGILLDFSQPMIEAAQHKLAARKENLTFVVQDYGTSSWVESVKAYAPFDVVVSGFSIHHQPDSRKRELYQEIYDLLKPGGIFLNLEHVAPGSPWLEQVFDEIFIDEMVAHNQKRGLNPSREAVADDYHHRPHKESNLLAPLDVQCNWLREIGFADVDCYLKIFELAMFGGIRTQ
ncbi:MAG: class I SAM-dependent methyltransferase [Chloroflexota bacterium]